MKRIISCIPNTITCLNLISGCIATILTFHLGETYGALTAAQWAYIAIGCAAVFDFLDGLSARVLKSYSLLGKELDSLCDMVSFGIAPGMLMFNTMIINGTCWVAALVALFIPVMGALRLAKFNIDETQATTFSGLPIPANALFWIGMSAWINSYMYPGAIVTSIIIIVISLCMVARFRMFSMKVKSLSLHGNVRRYALVIAGIAFVVFYGFSGLLWTILLYLLLSLLGKDKA